MRERNESRAFLTTTLPAIVGPVLLLIIGLGIGWVFALRTQVDGLTKTVEKIPEMSSANAALVIFPKTAARVAPAV